MLESSPQREDDPEGKPVFGEQITLQQLTSRPISDHMGNYTAVYRFIFGDK